MPVYSIDGVVPVVHPTAFVHPMAVLIGDVIVGPRCYVAPGASLRGDFGRLILEEGSNVQDNCVLHSFPEQEAVVEADGHVGHGAILHGCRVGRNALVGMNAVLMDGVVVGAESIVGAMSFVRAGFEIPPRSLATGIPAKVVRPVTEAELAWKSRGTVEYQELAQRALRTLRETPPLAEPEPGRRRFTGANKPLHQDRG